MPSIDKQKIPVLRIDCCINPPGQLFQTDKPLIRFIGFGSLKNLSFGHRLHKFLPGREY